MVTEADNPDTHSILKFGNLKADQGFILVESSVLRKKGKPYWRIWFRGLTPIYIWFHGELL
jgi:hypothetical protein